MSRKKSGFSTQVLPGEPVHTERRPDPCAIIVFGATGDLTRRKLMPALFNLAADDLLPTDYAVLGVGRRDADDAMFRNTMRRGISEHSRRGELDPQEWDELSERVFYQRGDYAQPELYAELAQRLNQLEAKFNTRGNRIFYLAVAPSSFPIILTNLRDAGLLYAPGEPRWSRVIIEKPFGRDLDSAQRLNQLVGEVLDESQTFRIDHYLGKETVQNILVLRFGNAIFEPLWNRKYIDHVQITASEAIGVEGRGRFYDETGALRDMVQSHLLQVLALCAMEPPISFDADDIRDEKAKVFRSLRRICAADVAAHAVRAQYRGYCEEPNVASGSRTPTFVALKLMLDTWRWQGVPFYLRTGKRLKSRVTEVAVCFRPVPLSLFDTGERCQRLEPNVLTLRVQPDEGIALRLSSKAPGEDLSIASVNMDFRYGEAFARQPQEAYERLLLDCMRGDATLFWRRDGVELAWDMITPILEAWESDTQEQMPQYEPGGEGPDEARELMHRDRRFWRALT